MERIVDALRRERRKRHRFSGDGLERAVGDMIVRGIEVRHVEHVPQWPFDAIGNGRLDMGPFEKSEMHGDRRFGFRNRDRDAMIANNQTQLVGKIAFEQVWPRHGGGVMAGRRHVAIGQAGVDLCIGGGRDADLRIESPKPPLGFASFRELVERIAQEGGVAVVELSDCCHGLTSIREALPSKRLGACNRFDGLRIDSLFHDPL